MGAVKRGKAWQAFTPSFADFDKGASTVTGRYRLEGKTCHITMFLNASGTAFNGNALRMFLPLAVSNASPEQHLACKLYHNTRAELYIGYCQMNSNDPSLAIIVLPKTTTGPQVGTMNNGVVAGASVGASNWNLAIYGTYQIA